MKDISNALWKGGLIHLQNVLTHKQQSLFFPQCAEPRSSVGSVQNLKTEGRWFDPRARSIFFPRIDDSHSDKIHSSFTAVTVRCYGNGYVVKQCLAWKEYCAKYW